MFMFLCLNKNQFGFKLYMNVNNQIRPLSYVKSDFVTKDNYVEQLVNPAKDFLPASVKIDSMD